MTSEWHVVTVSEAAVFALAGLGLSTVNGWAPVPSAVLSVLGCCVVLLVPGLLVRAQVGLFVSRAASGTALALLGVVAACIGMDFMRESTDVSLYLWSPQWEATSWQVTARGRALLVVLPACVISVACVRAASLEAERESTAARAGAGEAASRGFPRLAGWFGVLQLLVAQVQLTVAENESEVAGSEQLVLNSYDAIRDGVLVMLAILWVLETVGLLVFVFVDDLPGQITATVCKVLAAAALFVATFVLCPQAYVWLNVGLAVVHTCAAGLDVWQVWAPIVSAAVPAAVPAADDLNKPTNPSGGSTHLKFPGCFMQDLPALSRQSLERGIQQATRFAPSITRAARIRKVKNL